MVKNDICLVFSVLILGSGCDPSVEDREINGFSGLSKPHLPAKFSQSRQEFDFGSILSRGQTLHHEFKIVNTNKIKLNLIRGTALTPCCSSIGPLPGSVSPNETVKIPVELKTGSQPGRRAVQFLVETDSSILPACTLILRANILPEVEVTSSDYDDPVVVAEGSTSRTFQITSRSIENVGRSAPIDVKVSRPLSAKFIGSGESKKSDGVFESSRLLEVTYPKTSKSGPQSGELGVPHESWYSIRLCVIA